MTSPAVAWLRRHLPTRETIAGNRVLAPFAHHFLNPALWKLTRRSVPRGIAIGLFAGILVPFAHTLIAAALAIPARANVLVAALATWISNPLTWVLLFPSERAIGRFLLQGRHAHGRAPDDAVQGWAHWLLNTSGEIALGSLVLAVLVSALGYLLSGWVWREVVARRWRRRRHG